MLFLKQDCDASKFRKAHLIRVKLKKDNGIKKCVIRIYQNFISRKHTALNSWGSLKKQLSYLH